MKEKGISGVVIAIVLATTIGAAPVLLQLQAASMITPLSDSLEVRNPF